MNDFKTVNELIEKKDKEIAKLRQDVKDLEERIERFKSYARKI